MPLRIPFLSRDFSKEVLGDLPDTYFCRYLARVFSHRTAQEVVKTMGQLKLPLPRYSQEFLNGWEGGLLFLNQYGVVVRIEHARFSCFAKRVNDNPWVLQPLASIKAGHAIIEICPGCHQARSYSNSQDLTAQLKAQLLNYWDSKISNGGNLPVKTVRFPEGIPVVVDRGAVKKLFPLIPVIKRKLNELAREAAEAQKQLYEPLRQAFNDAWPDPQKMEAFWSLCESYKKEGKLVDGWNEKQSAESRSETWKGHLVNTKTTAARVAAELYECTLDAVKKTGLQPHQIKPGA